MRGAPTFLLQTALGNRSQFAEERKGAALIAFRIAPAVPRRWGGTRCGYASASTNCVETRDAIAMMVIIGLTPSELGSRLPSLT